MGELFLKNISYALHTVGIPSSCGILVYRLVTSIETRTVFYSTFVFFYEVNKICCIFKIRLLCFSDRLKEVVAKDDIRSVGPSQPEMIGLSTGFGL